MDSQVFLAALLNYVATVFVEIGTVFLNPGHFLSVAPLSMALLIAIFALTRRRRAKRGKRTKLGIRVLLNVLFPRRVFLHRSAKADYCIFLINNGLLFFVAFSALLTPFMISEGVIAGMQRFGIKTEAASASPFYQVCYTLIIVLVWDFSATYAHYLKHKTPIFWEFHKVHHSAEVMTPITALRRHPVDAMIGAAVTTLFLGTALALWVLISGRAAEPVMIFGSIAGIYLWRLLGYNLRHSHIWISYGDCWNRILISPAQHQIHHSNSAAHYDTNFGHIFSFWDSMLGTLYLPKEGERVVFGIEENEMKDLRTIGDFYFRPFVKAGRKLLNQSAQRSNS